MDNSKVAVLLEDLKAQFQVFGEGLQAVIQQTEQRFDKLERRFDGLEGRIDGVEQRFDGLERRMDGVERRFDGLEQKLDRHIEENRLEHRQMIQMIRELNCDVHARPKRVK